MMRKAGLAIVAIVIVVISITSMFAWMSSRPFWQMSVRNSPQGVIVEVYKSNAAQPTYKTVLAGQMIDMEIERATRRELPADLGQTVFYDETLRPGRWTVVLKETKIDIMERVLIIDGTTEIAPHE